MKQILLFSIIFLSYGFVVNAAYYAQDYDPDYLPYNFEDALEAEEFDECALVLEQYDAGYWHLQDKFEALQKGTDFTGSVWVPIGEGSAFNLNQLKDFTEEAIRTCLIDFREWTNEQEEIAEEEARKEAAERFEAEQQAKLEKALNECDFDYFDTLSDKEKMATYDERMACEEKQNIVEKELSPVENITTKVSDPVQIEPVVSTYKPPVQVVQTESVMEDSVEEDLSTSTESTSTEKVIEVTQEELDNMVEEKLSEKLNEVQSESEVTKPSFFKRVTNFLFGWMF